MRNKMITKRKCTQNAVANIKMRLLKRLSVLYECLTREVLVVFGKPKIHTVRVGKFGMGGLVLCKMLHLVIQMEFLEQKKRRKN